MNAQETLLTPELAATLLASPHARQRRISRIDVARYARAIREGRWVLSPDPILVDKQQMFNGGHRCAAVIAANRAIPILIDWDADASLFDVIDVGRRRQAAQFIDAADANVRGAAARLTLWYDHRFAERPAANVLAFDAAEIIEEAERHSETFTEVLPSARLIYEYTSLSKSAAVAAFSIAYDMGYQDQIAEFTNGVVDPGSVDANDPSRLLSDRFRRADHRLKRRQVVEDWSILVRAFNLFLQGKRPSQLVQPNIWPRVAESESDFRRRSSAFASRKCYMQKASRSQRGGGQNETPVLRATATAK